MILRILTVIAAIGSLFALACTDAAKPPVRVANAEPAKTTPSAPRPAVDEHGHADGQDAPRISLAEAKKEYDAGTAVIVDVRDGAAYQLEHVKDSLNIPTAQLDAMINKIPKGKKVIAYCS